MEEKDFYFELRYGQKITDYKKISEYSGKYLGEDLSEENVRNKYSKNGGIDQFMCDAMNKKFVAKDFDLKKLREIQDYFESYHKYYRLYFNNSREEFFSDFIKCLEWFAKQDNKCGYCGISSEELNAIVEKRDGNLTLNNRSKRSKGTLEIEKKDSRKDYLYSNCILSCPLCNNAKSNLIDEASWRKFFVEPMRKYYKSILGRELKHEIPKIDD